MGDSTGAKIGIDTGNSSGEVDTDDEFEAVSFQVVSAARNRFF